MAKKIIKLLLKYPIKIANGIFVNRFYKESFKRDTYEIDDILNSTDRVLVFSPHVDDETIGLGATLLKGRKLGIKMALVYMTDGGGSTSDLSRERLIKERKNEGYMVKESYGFEHIYFLDEPDGSLDSNKDDLINKLVNILDKERPSIIFTPFLIDGHKDHVETTKSVFKALEKWNDSFHRIYMYEVNCAISPQLITDITYMDYDLYNEKGSMYSIFKSQWVMGFDAFRLLDRGKRFLIRDKKEAYGAEVFVKADVDTLKAIDKALEAEGFKPEEFKQLSSDYNLILSFTTNADKKERLNNKVKDILNRGN